MQLKTKQFWDRFLGPAILRCLNIMAFLAGKILHRDHRFGNNVKVIAVCKLMGIGSIIQSTPMLKALKKKYPDCHLIYLTRSPNAAVFHLIPEVDTVLTIDDSTAAKLICSTFHMLRALWRAKVDIMLDLEVHSNISSILTICSMARNRHGYFIKPADFRMIGIYTHMAYYNYQAPRYAIYQQIARTAGVTDFDAPNDALSLTIPASLYEQGEDALKKLGITSPYIVISPSTSDLSEVRRWGAVNFRQVINALLKHYPDMHFCLSGTAGEYEYLAQHAEGVIDPARVHNLAGRLSFSDFAVLLKQCKLLIAVDSSPFHLACALGTPILALFGPVSPMHYQIPENHNIHVLYNRLYCSPCVHVFDIPPCGGNNVCMKTITPEMVIHTACAALNGEHIPDLVHAVPHLYEIEHVAVGTYTDSRFSNLWNAQ